MSKDKWFSGDYFCSSGCSNNGKFNARGYGIYHDPAGRESFRQFPNCKTNNEAEYRSLILLLEQMPPDLTARIFLYNDCVLKQLNGEFRVKSASLRLLNRIAKELMEKHPNVTLHHA
jgi:ribonuclease HI